MQLKATAAEQDTNHYKEVAVMGDFFSMDFLSSIPFFSLINFSFLQPHLQHMEGRVSYSCRPTPEPQQCQI